MTEICFNAAVREAQAQDQILKTSGKVVGPLHGIPVTLKDQFNVSGYDTTLGYTARAFQVAVTDAWLVSTLRRLGAIVIAKSNIPQSIMVIPACFHAEYADGTSGVRLKTLYGV